MDEKKLSKVVLDNGLTVVSRQLNITGAYVCVGINAGSADESELKNGLAHALEHMYFRSNRNRTGKEYLEAIEFQGMDTNAMTGFRETIYFFDLDKKDQISEAVELLYGSLSDNHFLDREFQIEKGAILSELRNYHRDPLWQFYDQLLYPSIYKGTTLEKGVIGTMDSVKGLKVSDLRRFSNRFYVPNNMVVTCAGEVEHEEFLETVSQTFGELDPKEFQKKPVDWQLRPCSSYSEIQELRDPDDRKLDQGFFYMVYPLNNFKNQDLVTAAVLEAIVGEGSTGLVNEELREKRGLCYSSDAGIDFNRGNPFMYIGSSGMHPNDIANAIEIIGELGDRLAHSNLPKDYFEGKIEQTAAMHGGSSYYLDELIENLIIDTFSGTLKDPSTMSQNIRQVSQAKVRNLASRIFDNEPLIVVASAPGYENKFDI